ncbi:MAG: GH92 family glycosyl hydrolase [Bacteroidales bacterium]|nr:GH92 family glycosyl hydrolase [Bacteroidales bacterium]
MKVWIKFIFIVKILVGSSILAQSFDQPADFVNTFIGTSDAHFPSKWEGHGRVYPGAVAPYGFVQLTPETRTTDHWGYDSADTSIYFFSCLGHHSGFPNGSAGQMRVMPLTDTIDFQLYQYNRHFFRNDEKAEPGYYTVFFSDNGTQVEMTASERSGIFRFTFLPEVTPYIYVGGMGSLNQKPNKLVHGSSHNAILEFSDDYTIVKQMEDGWILAFTSLKKQKKVVTLKLGISFTGFEGTKNNIETEIGNRSFDEIRAITTAKWNKELSVIQINDDNIDNKIKFYTALYRSKLIPWIVSDTDGFYKGSDGLIQKTKGKNQYGQFSPWDTFRSLHPLLCIIDPERQNDMILSMLDIYEQSSRLPKGPMTGNHVISIIVDSYLKGIMDFDKEIAYKAMKDIIMTKPLTHEALKIYDEIGYIPFTYPESVTKTVEFAYNDWVLAQFSKKVMKEENDYNFLFNRSFNYRNLFNPKELFLLPKNEAKFLTEPGNSGYKEGDKWVYTMFVPHNTSDLINHLGGDEKFCKILDEGFEKGHFTFDNEPVFHIPYLYKRANQPHKTQKYLRQIMDTYFTTLSGGLPGNDDLGSLSSWFVLNALGIYPVCPGQPIYDLGSPLFNKATIHLSNGKEFVIEAKNNSKENVYVKKITLNNVSYNYLNIDHATINNGGRILFEMSDEPILFTNSGVFFKDSTKVEDRPIFSILNASLLQKETEPDALVWIKFDMENNGAPGTRVLKLYANGDIVKSKNIYLQSNTSVTDSISCRLYAFGESFLKLNDFDSTFAIQVLDNGLRNQIEYGNLSVKPILRKDTTQLISFSLTNKGGYTEEADIRVLINGLLLKNEKESLAPGETKNISHQFKTKNEGLFNVEIDRLSEVFKVYTNSKDATVLDLPLQKVTEDGYYNDLSGFENHGIVSGLEENIFNQEKFWFDENHYVFMETSASLEIENESFTMMAWVFSGKQNSRNVSLITKGDFHVMQQWKNNSLTFFAGGWGRGECNIALPENWEDEWHHIACVSTGNALKIYINGQLKGQTFLRETALKNTPSRWHIGRNEEFPLQRVFNGRIENVKIFTEALSQKEIKEIIHSEEQLYKTHSIKIE